MNSDGVFFQAFVYLAAAVVSVPLAKRLGLGSVLGYLLAGVAIGPFGLHLVGDSSEDVMHFAEFGVVLMLFLVGLELQPSLLWKLRGPIFGWGTLQVAGTGVLIGVAGALLGYPLSTSLAAGLILAMSSTAIVLQVLQEKGWLKCPAGQSSFAVLLFQDISVIPILALLPMLARDVSKAAAATDGHGGAPGAGGWSQALLVLLVVAAIVVSGRYLLRPLFRIIARSGLREMFTATSLLIVVGISLLVQRVGLSPALGTFLAGVVLADSEYRHELEGDIEPFKGLLLGLFFISVGAGINFSLIAAQPGVIATGTVGLLVLKFVALFLVGRAFKMELSQNLLFALALAQGGEFCFVLLSFATQNHVLPADLSATLVSMVALSMALTPLLFIVYEKLIAPRFEEVEGAERPADEIDEHDNPVIVAGFGRFGHVIARFLSAAGIRSTVLDFDADQVELARKIGLKVFYGDATRLDLLRAAGAERAKMLVVAVDGEERILNIVRLAQKHFPRLTIMARAHGRTHEYELLKAGVPHVYRETMGSSMELGTDALTLLGLRAHQAHRFAKAFRRMDERMVHELLEHWGKGDGVYIAGLRERVTAINDLFDRYRQPVEDNVDGAWDTESIREEISGPTKPSA